MKKKFSQFRALFRKSYQVIKDLIKMFSFRKLYKKVFCLSDYLTTNREVKHKNNVEEEGR